MNAKCAFFTLLTSDSYLPGALVLCKKLKELGTTEDVCIIVTNESFNDILGACFDKVINVRIKESLSLEKLQVLGRRDLSNTMTKVELWNQTDYDRVVYLDCDCLPLSNLDDLFKIEVGVSDLAASPDCGWPDIFNSGVMVLKPDIKVYAQLMKGSQDPERSFDGADQGLLNQYFSHSRWKRLPFLYNVTPSAGYQYVPALQHFEGEIKNFHFIGRHKPWNTSNSAQYASCFTHSPFALKYLERLHKQWWECFDRDCSPLMSKHSSHMSETGVPITQHKSIGEARKLKVEKTKTQWENLQSENHDTASTVPCFNSNSSHRHNEPGGEICDCCQKLLDEHAPVDCRTLKPKLNAEVSSFLFPWELYRPAPQRVFPPLSPAK